MHSSRTSRPVWLLLAVLLLAACVFALTTQSRLCLYNGDTITDHLANKSTKTTEARAKAEIPPQLAVPAPMVDLAPEAGPPIPVAFDGPVLPQAPVRHPLCVRPPPHLS